MSVSSGVALSVPASQWKAPEDSYCSSCGSVVRRGLKFCNSCGASITGGFVPRLSHGNNEQLSSMKNDMDRNHNNQMRAVATTSSVVGMAWLTLLLYCIFYLPGLIVNIIMLVKCSNIKNATGHNVPGNGCMSTLFNLFFVFPLIAFIFALLAGVNVIAEFESYLH